MIGTDRLAHVLFLNRKYSLSGIYFVQDTSRDCRKADKSVRDQVWLHSRVSLWLAAGKREELPG
jgi:hypothetical protein